MGFSSLNLVTCFVCVALIVQCQSYNHDSLLNLDYFYEQAISHSEWLLKKTWPFIIFLLLTSLVIISCTVICYAFCCERILPAIRSNSRFSKDYNVKYEMTAFTSDSYEEDAMAIEKSVDEDTDDDDIKCRDIHHDLQIFSESEKVKAVVVDHIVDDIDIDVDNYHVMDIQSYDESYENDFYDEENYSDDDQSFEITIIDI